MSIWVCGGLVKLDFLFHKTTCYNLLCCITMSRWCGGQHSCISRRRPGFNSLCEPTYFQKSFFSISSFWDHQTFLYKISNLRNHLPSKCREGRVISHIKAYLLLQGLTSAIYFKSFLDHQNNLFSQFWKKNTSCLYCNI